jgi:hypothetical protein
VDRLGLADADAVDRDWPTWAHDGQQAPPQSGDGADWSTCVVMGGRGFGKTRAGSEWIVRLIRDRAAPHIALVGATLAEARRVMVEGRSGLLEVAGPWIREWRPSLGTLKFRDGAVATLFSGASPELLRGPEHDFARCDELAKWEKAQDCWDMLQFGLRLGERPDHHHAAPRPGAARDHGEPRHDRHRRPQRRQPAHQRLLAPRHGGALRRHPPGPPGARRRAPHRCGGGAVDGGIAGEVPQSSPGRGGGPAGGWWRGPRAPHRPPSVSASRCHLPVPGRIHPHHHRRRSARRRRHLRHHRLRQRRGGPGPHPCRPQRHRPLPRRLVPRGGRGGGDVERSGDSCSQLSPFLPRPRRRGEEPRRADGRRRPAHRRPQSARKARHRHLRQIRTRRARRDAVRGGQGGPARRVPQAGSGAPRHDRGRGV